MACGKELRIPKEWSKYHHAIVNEPIDPELFSLDELCAWLKDLDLCNDKSDVEKYVLAVRPYHTMRYQFVLLSREDALCKKLFKMWAHTAIAVFISDDVLECLSKTEMGQICNAFQLLVEKTRPQFSQFSTIAEMKQFLLLQKVDVKLMPHIIYFLDFANNVAKLINEQGNYSKEDVSDYWRRLVVMISLYYEGVKVEVSGSGGSYSKDIWTRLLAAGTMIWLIAQEVMSGALGKTSEHASLLNELYFLGTFYSMVLNDIYSHNRENGFHGSICNLLQTIVRSKDVPGEFEAVLKCIQILNTVVKLMYQKIETAKQKNLENRVLCKLLDNIGMTTTGCYFFHHYSHRYDDSAWRLSLVEVDDDELAEWQKCDDEEQLKEVMPLLLNYSQKANEISDTIKRGVVKINRHFRQ